MSRVALIARGSSSWARQLLQLLADIGPGKAFSFVDANAFCSDGLELDEKAACVYVPSFSDRSGMLPDIQEAERVIRHLALLRPRKLVLLSSALIFGTGPGRESLVGENHPLVRHKGREISRRWMELEAIPKRWAANVPLTILRPVTVLPSPSLLSRRLADRFTVTLPGHDPTLQLLSLTDLARALLCAIENGPTGVFNVAPDSVIPMHAAVGVAGHHCVSIPRTLQRLVRNTEVLEFLRYPWTVSNQKIKGQLGFVPAQSSAAAMSNCVKASQSQVARETEFDCAGMDRRFIDVCGRTLFKFLCDVYWRVESKGLEHVPGEGAAVLVGSHRGFMPWDAVMALHIVVREKNRIPRFLTHPGLLKFPFISEFITKIGGVVASQRSADRVLSSGELLGVYPEGVQGAFVRYRDAYKLQGFGRDDFVKMALRHRAPIVPFVNVGSAEALPVFSQIRSRRWTRYSDWPCIPISTFPFVPVPLPSKWHLQFLPAIHVEEYPPEAARDHAAVRQITASVRLQMQAAMDEMVSRRKSIFSGSIFETDGVLQG